LAENTSVQSYRAQRSSDGLLCVIKCLKSPEPSPEELARLRREFEIIRQINTPEVIKAYELINTSDWHAIILEDFGGLPLSQAFSAQTLPLGAFLTLAIKITRALSQIHQHHFIHKDINPSNILLNPNSGMLKIIDFSIASGLSSEKQNLRAPHILEGTLAYLSPEQTGRVNRSVDLRTDLYALGVTFYQLLADRLPFEEDEPVALVHSQIALEPPSLLELVPGLPTVLNALVMRLLAKNAAERYQSCTGLLADLEDCLEQFQTSGQIMAFELGRMDLMEQFHLPQKLYGRGKEISSLLEAFERAVDPAQRVEMVLVAGHPGIGKTSLVQELFQSLTLRGGYFISGKFDPMQRDIPYFALLQAWRALFQQILGEPASAIAAWRSRLLEALGTNAQIMLDVLPELELITGPQPAVVELPAGQAQNRYRLVFKNFVQVFTQPDHPLVLFLDDLQWADAASLELLDILVSAPEQQYLLILGAYRDNEITPDHAFLHCIDHIRQAGGEVTSLILAPLQLKDITHFVQDAFYTTPAIARPLAALLEAKTGGSPFFLNEFIKSLVARQLIHYERSAGWVWNLEQIRSQPITDNVVDLVTANIRQLSPQVQELLKLAAYLGGQFDLQTLALAYHESVQQTARVLWEAVRNNLILPLSDTYNLAAYGEVGDEKGRPVVYRFAHDRIRQAVESTISPTEGLLLHLHLGQLLNNLPPAEKSEKVFEIANHLNQAASLLGNEAEKQALAEANLLAGQRAKRSAAFQPAWHYFSAGLELLNHSIWQENYHLALSLYLEAIESGYSCGLLDTCIPLIETVLQNTSSLHDQSIAHQIMVKIRVAQNQPVAALEHALGVLKKIGVELPLYPSPNDLQQGIRKVQTALAGRPVEDLADLPAMSDPDRLAALQILTSTTVAAFNAIRPLYALISFERVYFSIQYGNTPMSPAAYASYGLYLCGDPDQIEQGYQFGHMALRLQEKLNALPYKARTAITAYSFVMHWKDPLRSILEPVLDAYQSGLETGDVEFASAALLVHAHSAFLSGLELTGLHETFQGHVHSIKRLGHPRNQLVLEMHLQLVHNLLQPGPTSDVISGEYYQEETALTQHVQGSDFLTIFRLYSYKVLIDCLFERYEQAAQQLKTLEKYLDSARSEFVSTLYYFYDSLVCLGLYSSLSKAEQAAGLEQVAANLAVLQRLAHYAPANQSHRVSLLEAELARLTGRSGEAREFYDQAIKLARENQFLQDEGLACERAATFYLERGQIRLAIFYLVDARSAYTHWGARGKVQQLDEKYAPYFSRKSDPLYTLTELSSTSSHAINGSLDVASLVKASQALSGEIVLEKLLDTLMKIIIENAGAQFGYLLLEENEQWLIAASGDNTVKTPCPIETEPLHMALSVVRYVIHTHETVTLDDAVQTGPFRRDSFICQHQVHSLLCLPLIKQSFLVGVLYLENNLAPGAFSPQQLEFLRLLSTQAAISIENARFYDTLEQKVAERTQELQQEVLRRRKSEELAQQLAITDPLTGLFNRRYFFSMLECELNRARRYQTNFGVLIVDLDHFKNVNDRYGHLVGDQVLKAIAELGKSNFREVDTLARYGGEEFVALLPQTNLENTLLAAERLRQLLADNPIMTSAGPVEVKASLGVTTFNLTGDHLPDSLLERADRALYRAKNEGRNRVAWE
jgi:diguanylate cyclase (GGDEF)-like protein